jgi:hypothetical protein
MQEKDIVVVIGGTGPAHRRTEIARVTLPIYMFRDAGRPKKCRLIYLGPGDEGGPAWIIKPHKGGE